VSYREWHYQKVGREWGPLTLDELQELVAEGHVEPWVQVRRADLADWMPLTDVVDVTDGGRPLPVLPADGILTYEIPRARPQRLYAGFGARFGAFLLDYFVVGIPIVGALHVIDALGLPMREWLRQALFVTFAWLYYALLESSPWQGTLGKHAAGLIVTDVHGQPVSFGRATARLFAKALSFCTFYIGFLMISWTRRSQGLHDLIAGTLVLRK
jgi:uncharacterized RDD family membrane protein YckC